MEGHGETTPTVLGLTLSLVLETEVAAGIYYPYSRHHSARRDGRAHGPRLHTHSILISPYMDKIG